MVINISKFKSEPQTSNCAATGPERPALESACVPPAASRCKMFEDSGNKCGKCQNHEYEVLKKGHARECPFKKCDCRRCRLLDARSDILQVISGKQQSLKGTKKDPNCGFCQNHNVQILRKGHVRSCSFGQASHFLGENCFDCEVHYIRNEVNRLQIKMRRAMKEDRTLSEEQRKTAREAITRDEVEKVCQMARLARKKREAVLAAHQVASGGGGGESSQQAVSAVCATATNGPGGGESSLSNAGAVPSCSANLLTANLQYPPVSGARGNFYGGGAPTAAIANCGIWRPWSQQQFVAAMAAQQQQQQPPPTPPPPPPATQPIQRTPHEQQQILGIIFRVLFDKIRQQQQQQQQQQ